MKSPEQPLAPAGNISGYCVDEEGRHSYGEHRQFLVAIGAVSLLWQIPEGST